MPNLPIVPITTIRNCSIEHITHYNCGACGEGYSWWTVADKLPKLDSIVFCPHCGAANLIDKITDPMNDAPDKLEIDATLPTAAVHEFAVGDKVTIPNDDRAWTITEMWDDGELQINVVLLRDAGGQGVIIPIQKLTLCPQQ
jgi:DNA-directed RNA polymerase subunit RPC12/RpoP